MFSPTPFFAWPGFQTCSIHFGNHSHVFGSFHCHALLSQVGFFSIYTSYNILSYNHISNQPNSQPPCGKPSKRTTNHIYRTPSNNRYCGSSVQKCPGPAPTSARWPSSASRPTVWRPRCFPSSGDTWSLGRRWTGQDQEAGDDGAWWWRLTWDFH